MHITFGKRDNILLVILLVVSMLCVDSDLFAQNQNNTNSHPNSKKSTKQPKELKLYPDEYAELDEVPLPKSTKDEYVLKILEHSRQKYLQALILIERKDTTNATKYFEEAITLLNPLVSYPGIEQNDDFTDLAQSIIEDYESFVQDIDKLDETSSLFIFRDKLFAEIDVNKPNQNIKIQPIQTNLNDSLSKAIAVKSNEKQFTIPMDDNEHVQKSIEFLTQNKVGRKFLKNCMERYGKWGPMIKKIIAEENMPEEMIYLGMIESALNPLAVSKAKAVGLWQFIRSTGEDYGLNKSSSVWIDERRNPEKATRAAMRHLRDLYNDLGNWHLAMAAYNYGQGGVRKSIAKSRLNNPDYWELRPFLPKETRNYVPLYIATAIVVSNPTAYGIKPEELNLMEEFKSEPFLIKEPISVKALAKCANLPLDKFIEYNPELISSCTPPDMKEYKLNLPEGSSSIFASALSTLTPEEKQPWVSYTVAKGENITSISRKYGIAPEVLASANAITSVRTKLKTGTTLRIPLESITPSIELADQKPDNKQQSALSAEPISVDTLTSSNSQFITHTVVKGENLYGIAQRYGVRLTDLRNLNNLPYDQQEIENGRELKISLNNTTSASNTTIKKITTPIVVKHVLRSGETLAQIADDYDVSVQDIRKWNRISENPKIGQSLKIITSNVKVKDKPADKSYASRLANPKPAKAKEVAENIQSKERKKLTTHKVAKGENIGSISAKYGVTESELRKWNPKLISGNKILSGTKLKIYPDQPSKGSSVSQSKKVNKLPKYYVVRKGDTVKEIADKFGVSITSLKSKNKKLSEKSIQKGQKIRIQ